MKKVLIIIVCIGIIITAIIFARQKSPEDTIVPNETIVQIPTEITHKEIKEENYSGERPIIKGTRLLATTAQKYVDERIKEFSEQANKEVPDMREQFGDDALFATYSIEIRATQKESTVTESIVMTEYVYTGGANGMSSYKAFNASRADGHIIPITEIIRKDKQSAFVEYVKKELLSWQPDGAEGLVVFNEDVEQITLDSFEDWSQDDESFIIYFDKYSIGPGALGAVAFPLPLSVVENYLSL
jgi:hypothetical protein